MEEEEEEDVEEEVAVEMVGGVWAALNTAANSLSVSCDAPMVKRWAGLRTRGGLGVAELKKRKKTRQARNAGGVMEEEVKWWLLTRVLNK